MRKYEIKVREEQAQSDERTRDFLEGFQGEILKLNPIETEMLGCETKNVGYPSNASRDIWSGSYEFSEGYVSLEGTTHHSDYIHGDPVEIMPPSNSEIILKIFGFGNETQTKKDLEALIKKEGFKPVAKQS